MSFQLLDDFQANDPNQPLEYAGFWLRTAAMILDSLIISIPTFIVAAALAGGDMERAEQLSNVLSLLTGWLYHAVMESSAKQATFGKQAVGIVVTDMEGRRIGFGAATGRYFGKILSALILLIGFFMAAFTDKKQALHDMMASTLVVMQRK